MILDRKAEVNATPKIRRKSSMFLLSEDYKRKMSDALEVPEEELSPRRKISWGDEHEFVLFNKNKSCQAIRQAQRHKFSIDE